MTSLAIFDYGAGNIFSLKNALERVGSTVDIITTFTGKVTYDGLLLPGVGNFDPAIRSIIRHSKTTLQEYVNGSIPVLGICLGMEMFFEKSQEGKEDGLGVMDGSVVMLPPSMKIPHMGWNSLEIKEQGKILQGVEDSSWVYFVHSYMAEPTSNGIVTASSDYGIKIPAVVEQGNYYGTQFHPEKSGSTGKTIIRNFIRECKR